jgi:type I restriction enzyme, S subunit
MNNWEEKKFGDLVHFPPKLSFRKKDTFPFIPMEDVQPGTRYVESNQEKIYTGGGAKFANKDILFARITPSLDNKKIAQVKNLEKGFGSTEFFVFRARKDEVDSDFLYYLSISDLLVQSGINSYVGASGRQRADEKFLKKVLLNIPPLKTQKKIAAILTAYDDLIEINNRRIQILKKMAEEIYREWFVRFRFPGYEKVKLKKNIPEDWIFQKIENAFEFTGGGTPSTEESKYWVEGNINWYAPSDITSTSEIFMFESSEKITEFGLEKSSAKIFPAYSIMLTSRATIGAIGINTTIACTNQGFITCIPNDIYPLYYLFYWLKLSKSFSS